MGTIETELSTATAKLERVLKIGYYNARIQIKKVENQISTLGGEIDEAVKEKKSLQQELSKLEDSKKELSNSVLEARKESKKFTDKIDDIDRKLHRLDDEYERAERLLGQLRLNAQTLQMQLDQRFIQLNGYGYEKVLEVSPEQIETTEASLRLMHYELERLGAVNQLALTHYTEQIGRYKELSIRTNELEKEKQAILTFMDEIEQKKRQVFMEAYRKINENFRSNFCELSDGGEASLKLENIEDPFAGGMDMEVQFPGKPPILVSGASSGERSVSAVAFLFSIQDYMPTAFYVFDEVDAHLDVFHVAKLGELFVRESTNSQFIVITLKPELANKAERVYGVFERNGVSHVISTSFKEDSK